MNNLRTIADLQEEVKKNQKFHDDFVKDPLKSLEKISPTREIPNTKVYHIVVGALGLAILFVIVGVIILAVSSETIDPTVTTLFTAIASGAVGALSGLLAPSPNQ